MMNFKERLAQDLRDERIVGLCDNINFGVKFEEEPISDTYICYQITDRVHVRYQGDLYMGDQYTIEIDIFSKGNYVDLEETIITVLESKGYLFQKEYEVYIEDKGLYEALMMFKYIDI